MIFLPVWLKILNSIFQLERIFFWGGALGEKNLKDNSSYLQKSTCCFTLQLLMGFIKGGHLNLLQADFLCILQTERQ